jgi:hypothetical protein
MICCKLINTIQKSKCITYDKKSEIQVLYFVGARAILVHATIKTVFEGGLSHAILF